jgi:hypothetical protein
MQKCFVGKENKFSATMLVLPLLSALVLTMTITPMAQADTPSMWLEPPQGPAGTLVIVHVRGLPGPTLDVSFDTISLGTATTWPGTSSANRAITVPQVPPDTYTVSAKSYAGVATAAFTVTQGSSPTAPEKSDGSPTGLDPTNPPVTASTGFWSPLTIAITSAVIASAIFATLYVKRGRQQTPQYQETSHYEPRLTAPPKKTTAPSKTNQSINKSQQPPFTKICRHCKQTVRDDLNVCPYCLKRLR